MSGNWLWCPVSHRNCDTSGPRFRALLIRLRCCIPTPRVAVIVKPNHKRAVSENHRPFCLVAEVARDNLGWRPESLSAILRVKHRHSVPVLVGAIMDASSRRGIDLGSLGNNDRLNPIWKHIGGGCHLNRKIDELFTHAGFQIDELRTIYLPGPRPMTYTYQGSAHVQ